MNIDHNLKVYESRYENSYGCEYPESHIIRAHKHVLEWELNMVPGRIFDFGCGIGANLLYFASQGFTPYGCDTNTIAIEKCRKKHTHFADNFFCNSPETNLLEKLKGVQMDVFLANQVFCFMEDDAIKPIISQAHHMLRKGGVFIASMMDYSCFYHRYSTEKKGDFEKVCLELPRTKDTLLINFKNKEELEPLFQPFRKLHIGMYGSHIREEEGFSTHWLYIGIKN